MSSRSKKHDLIKLGSKEFAELQSHWYDKLKQDGFNDLEWTDSSSGFGQDTPYLKRPSALMQRSYRPEKEFYFRLFSNYMVHCESKIDAMDRFILRMHVEGTPYRTIMKHYNNKFGTKRSLFYIFYTIKKYKNKMIQWNHKSINGMLKDTPLFS